MCVVCVCVVCVSVCVCRIANGVLEKVAQQLLSRNLKFVTDWLNGAGAVLDIMGQDALLKLFKLAH